MYRINLGLQATDGKAHAVSATVSHVELFQYFVLTDAKRYRQAVYRLGLPWSPLT